MKILLILFISLLFITPVTGVLIKNNNNNMDIECNEIFNGNLLINSDGHQWSMYMHDFRHTGQSEYDTSDNPGVEKWKYRIPEHHLIHTAVIDKDGILYTGSTWNDLYAVYPNGTLKWKQKLTSTQPQELAIGPDGIIYVGNTGHFCAYYPNSTLKWIFHIDGDKLFYGYPTIDSNGTVYVGTADGYLYAIHPNGTLKWRNTDSKDVRGPALDNQGNVYFTSRDMHLYCLNPNGTLKWKSKEITLFDFGPVIGDDGLIYALPRWNRLYAFTPDGSEKWMTELPDSAGRVSITPDGTIIVCGEDDAVIAINSDNGDILWTYEVKDIPIQGSMTSAAIGSDGTIYFAYPNCMCALNPDGTLKWKEHLSTDIYPYDLLDVLSNPSIGKDGTVYITTSFWPAGAYIHAIGKGNPGAPSTPLISGKKAGFLTYELIFVASSPSSSDLYYIVDWDDCSDTTWIGPYHSSESIKIKHSYIDPSFSKYYQIAVRAKDVNGLCSAWGEISIRIPFTRSNELYNSLFLSFLEQFPILQQLLNRLG